MIYHGGMSGPPVPASGSARDVMLGIGSCIVCFRDDDGEKDGYAWYGSICGNDNYAVAKVHQILYFSLVTHEIGHA